MDVLGFFGPVIVSSYSIAVEYSSAITVGFIQIKENNTDKKTKVYRLEFGNQYILYLYSYLYINIYIYFQVIKV